MLATNSKEGAAVITAERTSRWEKPFKVLSLFFLLTAFLKMTLEGHLSPSKPDLANLIKLATRLTYFWKSLGYLGDRIATDSNQIARTIYLERPISRAILKAIGNSHMALSQVVSKTGLPREEVATWLLDMERNGLISHSIELPNDRAEAVFCLSPKARPLLQRLAQ